METGTQVETRLRVCLFNLYICVPVLPSLSTLLTPLRLDSLSFLPQL